MSRLATWVYDLDVYWRLLMALSKGRLVYISCHSLWPSQELSQPPDIPLFIDPADILCICVQIFMFFSIFDTSTHRGMHCGRECLCVCVCV